MGEGELRLNIEELQEFLAETYPNSDVSFEFIVNRIVANLGIIASDYERGTIGDAPFVEVVAWLFAIFTKAEKSLWKELLLKYPNCCSDCLALPCICSSTGGIPMAIPVAKVSSERRYMGEDIINRIERNDFVTPANEIPYINSAPSIDQVLNMLERIYPLNDVIYRHNPDFFFLKFLRSSGRLSDACTKSRFDKSRAKVTDNSLSLFCWVISFWRLSMKGKQSFSATVAVEQRYEIGCPICGEKPCACGDNKYNRLMSFDIVSAEMKTNDPREAFRQQVLELNKSFQDQDIPPLSEGIVDSSKAEVLDGLERKRKALEEMDKASGAASNIAKRLAGLSAWVAENWPF